MWLWKQYERWHQLSMLSVVFTWIVIFQSKIPTRANKSIQKLMRIFVWRTFGIEGMDQIGSWEHFRLKNWRISRKLHKINEWARSIRLTSCKWSDVNVLYTLCMCLDWWQFTKLLNSPHFQLRVFLCCIQEKVSLWTRTRNVYKYTKIVQQIKEFYSIYLKCTDQPFL